VKGSITSVQELILALEEGPGQDGYLSILKRLEIPVRDLVPLCTWHQKHYTRNCLSRNADFELFLICYEKGQRTSIHDYDSQEAWVHPVSGEVTEERFALGPNGALRLVNSTVLRPPTFSYMHNGSSVHRYVNTHDGRSITLNLYAKPLRKWKVYDETTGDPSTMSPGPQDR